MAPLALALVCASVAGDKLTHARKQASQLDFTAALVTAREALEAGDADPVETAAIHSYTGELAAALGDRDLARGEFARALVLNPSLDLPGASPRIKEPLSEARKQVGGKALSVAAASTRASDGTVSTSVTWAGDLYSLAVSGRVYVERAGKWVAVEDPRRWSCPSEPCRYWAAAVDAHGNQLARTGGPDGPFALPALEKPVASVVPETVAPVAVVSERAWYQKAGPYLTLLAAAAAGLAVYFGVQFQSDQQRLLDVEAHRAQHTMAEAVSLDSARQRDRILAFSAIGVAGVAAVIACFTW